MKMKYRCLDQLLCCYFHADWLEELLTPRQVVEVYLNEWSAREFPDLLFELNDLLAQPEPGLREAAHAMGCHYYPPGDGISYRHWFKSLAEQVAAHVHSASLSWHSRDDPATART